MKFKELFTVLDSNAYLNIVSEKKVNGCTKAKLFYYNGGLINGHI